MMLRGKRFRRLHPCVYVLADHEMSWHDHVRAAQLALPGRVHLTGISRLQMAGLPLGPRLPVRFVVEGDHHLAHDGIFLHRTKRLPPTDAAGVSLEAAYVSYCSLARTVDAAKAGDWMLRHLPVSTASISTWAQDQLWRPGADEALWVLPHLDGRSRSPMESELRLLLTFAGLEDFEVNPELDLGGNPVTPDLRHRGTGLVVEYEGTHHQADRAQYVADIDRTALYRRHGVPYVQLTRESSRRPGESVRRVHRALCHLGYAGPDPVFGERWRTLFASLTQAVGPRTYGRR